MSTVQEIETAVRQLSRKELSAFRDWFQEFDAEASDREVVTRRRKQYLAGAASLIPAEEGLRQVREELARGAE